MLIEYYKQTNTTSLDATSPIFRGHNFTLHIDEGSLLKDKEKPTVKVITGVLNKLPALHYTTQWGNSSAAKVTDVLKKITEHKYLKMFAQNDQTYRPPIVTDGWTQQVPQTAEPIAYDLEFRAYPFEMFNTSAYSDIIKFLLFATTPSKFNVSDTVNYIETAAKQAYEKGEELATILNNFSHNFDTNTEFSKINAIKKAVEIVEQGENGTAKSTDLGNKNEQELAHAIVEFIHLLTSLSDMSEQNTGGCPLIKADIPNLSTSVPGLNSNNEQIEAIPWIITNWSFKPAVNTTDKNYPIFIDFKITMQTQYVLTNASLLK